MTRPLRLRSAENDDLDLAREHASVVAPRNGSIDWGSFDPKAYAPEALARAGAAWRERARQEFASLTLFTELASQAQRLGAPLDWSGAFARMIGDEVRHTELCARLAALLDPGSATLVDEPTLDTTRDPAALHALVSSTLLASFCVGETISGRVFRRCARVATVGVAREVVRTIVDDETFHGRVGWELFALSMREGGNAFKPHREDIARSLGPLFRHYRALCGAEAGESWARDGAEAPPSPNFGTLSARGYARAFYDAMSEDVVPALVAIGFPQADRAWSVLCSERMESDPM